MATVEENRPFRHRPRLVSKNSTYNIKTVGIRGKGKHLMNDFFTTMVDTKWRWNMLIFVSGFVITWLFFALFYWLVSKLHGDISDVKATDKTPCFENVDSFTTAYLFSIETQTTIGYGFRYVTEECPYAVIGVLLQNIIGAGLQAALAGLVVAKVRRGKKRSGTLMFSSVACIVEEDGIYKLVIRIGDMRRSHIIGAHVRGHLFKTMRSTDGGSHPVKCFPMEFNGEDGSPQLFMAWPTQLVHTIDNTSPFWKISREDLQREDFELVVILDGIVSTTSNNLQTQTSYMAWDILWGHRFNTMAKKYNDRDSLVVDFANFNRTHPVSMSDCSAYQVDAFRKLGYSIIRGDPENNNPSYFEIKKNVHHVEKMSPGRILHYRHNKASLSSSNDRVHI
ncbi:inward rectifier potassium channel 2-like [Saccostrea echinata]|uniref:inward rectifier potassium channel 2-like n=1 Tax=Saccostrea echinata TaxID=191078 RepID=UPI002A7EDF10|nr:inward rectifier potassium channel 2-like [Saccostrea echinata]XP_061165953.1 inward rectifier potassium channel 2-like [Saccostrea echinata]